MTLVLFLLKNNVIITVARSSVIVVYRANVGNFSVGQTCTDVFVCLCELAQTICGVCVCVSDPLHLIS